MIARLASVSGALKFALGANFASGPSSVTRFLKSVFFVGLTIFGKLDPIRRAVDGPRLIHLRHSSEMISITLGKLLRLAAGVR